MTSKDAVYIIRISRLPVGAFPPVLCDTQTISMGVAVGFQLFVLLLANPYSLLYIAVTTVTVYLLGCRIQGLQDEQSQYLKAHKGLLGKDEKRLIKKESRGSRFAFFWRHF